MSAVGLPLTYRWTVLNTSGVILAANSCKVYQRRAKNASDGALSYEAAVDTVTITTGTVANNPARQPWRRLMT